MRVASFSTLTTRALPFIPAARITLLEALTGCSLHFKYLDGQPLHVQVRVCKAEVL
jgi:hypothetical protein